MDLISADSPCSVARSPAIRQAQRPRNTSHHNGPAARATGPAHPSTPHDRAPAMHPQLAVTTRSHSTHQHPGIPHGDGESGAHPNSLGRQCAPHVHPSCLSLHQSTAPSTRDKPISRWRGHAHLHPAQPPRARTAVTPPFRAPGASNAPFDRPGTPGPACEPYPPSIPARMTG